MAENDMYIASAMRERARVLESSARELRQRAELLAEEDGNGDQ